MGAGGDGDGLGGTGIPIIGARPGILVIYATNSKFTQAEVLTINPTANYFRSVLGIVKTC